MYQVSRSKYKINITGDFSGNYKIKLLHEPHRETNKETSVNTNLEEQFEVFTDDTKQYSVPSRKGATFFTRNNHSHTQKRTENIRTTKKERDDEY